METKPTAYVVMGVSGCGKSTVAKGLAEAKSIEMLDADDYHPQSNIDKMATGSALTDQDRAGWLEALNQVLAERLKQGESVVLACSALKQRYRDVIESGLSAVCWIYLKGDEEILSRRLGDRKGHFMPASLLASQLNDLEEPENAIVVDIRLPLPELIRTLIEKL